MYLPLMFINAGWQEILLVLLIVLILFGAKKLPDLARSLGKSLGEFKKGKIEGEQDDIAGKAEPASDADQSDDDKDSKEA